MKVIARKPVSAKVGVRTPSQGTTAPREVSDGLWGHIATKAYELWDTRGRRDGYALQDWLDAERIVMDGSHEARE